MTRTEAIARAIAAADVSVRSGTRTVDERIVVKRDGVAELVPFWAQYVWAAEAVVNMETVA